MSAGSSSFSTPAEAAARYVEWDPNPETRTEAEAILKEGDPATLTALFGSRLEFGTAGLRAAMGPGFSRMNDLTVLQTAQVCNCFQID
jgi:hypothetical protein